MGRYFVLPEEGIGPGGDIIFRRHVLTSSYRLFVGEQFFGTVDQLCGAWTGTSWAPESEFFNVRQLDGFATRFHAAQFVIKHHGYWMRSGRETRALAKRMENAK